MKITLDVEKILLLTSKQDFENDDFHLDDEIHITLRAGAPYPGTGYTTKPILEMLVEHGTGVDYIKTNFGVDEKDIEIVSWSG